jgi:hypothetical protein
MSEGMGGAHEFRVTINTNDPDMPEKALTVLSNWVE